MVNDRYDLTESPTLTRSLEWLLEDEPRDQHPAWCRVWWSDGPCNCARDAS